MNIANRHRLRPLAVLVLALAVAGCINGNVRQTDVAYYDLPPSGGEWRSPGFPLRTVEVSAPSWLGIPEMQYRLSYADAPRRLSYTESRWVAPPPELIESALRRRVVSSESFASDAGCRVKVDVDEFIQVFDSAQGSRSVLNVRLALQAPRSDQILARRTLQIAKPAPSADARGGVAGFGAAVQDLGWALGDWLGKIATETPAAAARCRGA